MSKINAVCIKNPFQPRLPENRDERQYEYNGQTIRQIFCDYYPIPNPDVEIVASINGKIYQTIEWDHELEAEDFLVFVPVPKGGGGGSNVVSMIAMIAVAALAWYAGGLAFSAMYGAASAAGAGVSSAAWGAMQLAGGLVSAGIMVGGGLLVSSIFPTKIPEIDSGLEESSPTYGWGVFNNASQEGVTLPIIIGERRVVPPVISAHSESIGGDSYLYVLYAVSEGPIDSIYGIEINDQPLSYFSDVEIATRLGSDSQDIIPYFNDTYSDQNINLPLNKNAYIIRETTGTGIDAAQVHLSLPQGLWHANKKGEFVEQSMTFSIQYRLKGSSTWTNYVATSDTLSEPYIVEKIYNVGEQVTYYGNTYRCKGYLVDREYCTTTSGDGDPICEIQYGVFTDSISTKKTLINRDQTIIKVYYSTPPPTNSTYWELLYTSDSSAVSGSSTTPINRTYRINFPSKGQYEIQCLILDGPPENDPKYGSKAIWSGLTEIVTDDFTYPGIALLGLKIKATDQLSNGMPKVSCVAKKINATLPIAGVLTLTNPADASYYVLTNPVWGGRIPESDLITSEFANWRSFCIEHELTCSLYIDQTLTYNSVKNYLCEVGRANVVQYGTKYGVIIDKETVPTQMFTIGNIIKDSFKMDYLPMDDRANCIRVNYYDKQYNWEKATVEIRTENYISSDREVSQDVTLYACDNKENAIKHGTLLLNYNKHLLRTCSFDVSIDALACTVGDVILVQHDTTYYGFGGRIISIDGKNVTLDRKILLSAGVVYGLIARNSNDDTIESTTFTVATDGEYNEIVLATAFSAGIVAGDLYSAGQQNIEAKPFRIISISRSQEFTRKISALEYYPEVYNDTAIVESVTRYMQFTTITGLTATEVFDNDYAKTTKVMLTWSYPRSADEFIIKMRDNENTDAIIGSSNVKSFLVDSVPIGVPITFTVYPKNNIILKGVVSGTFWGEGNAIYENGCYEFGIFATPQLQQIVGTEPVVPLWIQEPNSVEVVIL